MKTWMTPELIQKAAYNVRHQTQPVVIGTIDFSRPFIPESYTQLYYTPLYRQLSDTQRLRYNQLFGIRTNEYIMTLESDLVENLLIPLCRHPKLVDQENLLLCLQVMIEEERVHYREFLKINQCCLPGVFINGCERYFSQLPPKSRSLMRLVRIMSRMLAFPLWYFMAMEEASMAMARVMTKQPMTETLGELEPNFVAVHREHMKDETRHVHIDGHLIEACIVQANSLSRWANAYMFKRVISAITCVERTGSGVKVIQHLVKDRPELRSREEELICAVTALSTNSEYQRSLFNRNAMPLTFGIFDRLTEFDNLNLYLVGYEKH